MQAMRKVILTAGFMVLFTSLNSKAVVPPKDGGSLPDAYFEAKSKNRRAFMPKRAWIKKTLDLKQKRLKFISEAGGGGPDRVPGDMKVSGTFNVPVFLGNFANTTAPYPSANLQTELFTGPWTTGTMTQFYSEISYGNLNVTGSVYNWVNVSKADTYYEGSSHGMSPGDAHTGEFIKEILDARDGAVDFGQFDNDGPDGIPNSGDDDGFVDFIAIVHPEVGAECGNSNIWSHSWGYSGWPIGGNSPYVTNDPKAGGGFIKVEDYVIQPALSCNGATMIEIGVFCHEFGHAFGLPDLYDTDGGSSGIGHWGLMGSGSWNSPSSPSHMCAWSKIELGWITPAVVTWQGSVQSIPEIETNAVCFKLPFSRDRFRRLLDCAHTGTASLRCGLTGTEGNNRNWKASGGYGNGWDEYIEREFVYNGSNPVTLQYDYSYQLESDYDYGFTILDVGGSESLLKTYTGNVSGTESINLAPYLTSYSPPQPYKIKFRFTSDYAWSDEDGKNATTCGALVIDNLSVTGGGESYSSGFESFVDGWYQDPSSNPKKEYWLVENRNTTGFDANLHSPGLLIWHVDEEVMNSAYGNSGGGTTAGDQAVRGLVLEEADGNSDLLLAGGANRGDSGDAFPGSTSNTSFNSASSPNSNTNRVRSTKIEVSSISSAGPSMTAFLRAGDPPPVPLSVAPDTLDNDVNFINVTVSGNLIRHGASFEFRKSGETSIVPTSVDWIDKRRMQGEIKVYSKRFGFWNLIITNPDGQIDSVPNALYLNFKVAAKLTFARLKSLVDGIEVSYSVSGLDPGERIIVTKASSIQGPWIEPEWRSSNTSGNEFHLLDSSVEAGGKYYYRIESVTKSGSVSVLYTGSAVAQARRLILYQNIPNPFNPTTSISFYVPERMRVEMGIYNASGKLVRTLASHPFSAGYKTLSWDGRDNRGGSVASGIYFYKLKAGTKTLTRKMALIR